MSGERGCLQAIICEFCNRKVVYIHCFCHRLHLVIKAVMGGIEELNEHFSKVSALYRFFKLAAAHEAYSGDGLKQIIYTPWSGHLLLCKVVQENYKEIVKTLESAVTNKRLKAEDSVKAISLYVQATGRDFIFFSHFITEVLISCDIACKILQSSKENINVTSNSCVRRGASGETGNLYPR